MTAAILVPLSTELEGARLHAWDHVRGRLTGPVVAGPCVADAWSKGTAIARARQLVDVEVLVVHDADVFVNPHALYHAIAAVYDGAPWAIPHAKVWRLTEFGTALLIAGETTEGKLDRPPYNGVPGGGITVVRSDVYDDCPLDPRFVGWGSEDEAWGWALTALHGPPVRGDAVLTHLWHPHAEPGARRGTSYESHKLWRGYLHAREAPPFMRSIVDGARAAVVEALRSPPCLGTSSSAAPSGAS